jgi:hypothetical protein
MPYKQPELSVAKDRVAAPRGFAGIGAALVVSLLLWAFLMIGVLGLVFKILS